MPSSDTDSFCSNLNKEQLAADADDGSEDEDYNHDPSYQEEESEEESEDELIEESQDLVPAQSKKQSSRKPSSSKRKDSSGSKKKSKQLRQPLKELDTGVSNSQSLKVHKETQKKSKMVSTCSKGGGKKVVSKEDQLEVSH